MISSKNSGATQLYKAWEEYMKYLLKGTLKMQDSESHAKLYYKAFFLILTHYFLHGDFLEDYPFSLEEISLMKSGEPTSCW